MVKMTRIKFDLISDNDMHLFIEKGLRGGISYISKRYSKANNNTCRVMTVMKKNYYLFGCK